MINYEEFMEEFEKIYDYTLNIIELRQYSTDNLKDKWNDIIQNYQVVISHYKGLNPSNIKTCSSNHILEILQDIERINSLNLFILIN